MRIKLGLAQRRSLIALALVACLSLFVAACGDDDEDTNGSSGGSDNNAAATSDNPKCGLGNGKKASGAPIKIGGIATKQPGTDFSEIPATAKAFFDCVNDNGGINGRPVGVQLRDRADRSRARSPRWRRSWSRPTRCSASSGTSA